MRIIQCPNGHKTLLSQSSGELTLTRNSSVYTTEGWLIYAKLIDYGTNEIWQKRILTTLINRSGVNNHKDYYAIKHKQINNNSHILLFLDYHENPLIDLLPPLEGIHCTPDSLGWWGNNRDERMFICATKMEK